MEAQLGAPQGHAHAHDVDPHDTGLRTGMEGEEKQHDEKPAVLKKVKEKVKKIKNKIGIKKNDDDGGRDRESDSSSSEGEAEEDDGYKEDDEPVITSAPVSEKRKLFEASESQRATTGDAKEAEPEKVRLGDSLGDVKEDPAAPLSTNPGDRGGEEIGITPVIQSFEAISVSDNAKLESNEPRTEVEQPKPESQPSDTVSSADQPNVTYTEKIKSMATVPAEYGKNIASTVYDRISTAGTAVVQKIRGGPTKKGDTETSGAVSRDASQDKGVSVKEYVSEKLKPGEEDEALSDMISEVVQRNKEGIQNKASEGMATAQTRAGGVRMVEKIRGAVTSAVGGGKGSNIPADAKSVTAEAEGIITYERGGEGRARIGSPGTGSASAVAVGGKTAGGRAGGRCRRWLLSSRAVNGWWLLIGSGGEYDASV